VQLKHSEKMDFGNNSKLFPNLFPCQIRTHLFWEDQTFCLGFLFFSFLFQDVFHSSLCFALCLRISAQECFILLKMSEMEKPFSQFLQKLPSIIKNVVIQIEFLDNLNKSSTAPQVSPSSSSSSYNF